MLPGGRALATWRVAVAYEAANYLLQDAGYVMLDTGKEKKNNLLPFK